MLTAEGLAADRSDGIAAREIVENTILPQINKRESVDDDEI